MTTNGFQFVKAPAKAGKRRAAGQLKAFVEALWDRKGEWAIVPSSTYGKSRNESSPLSVYGLGLRIAGYTIETMTTKDGLVARIVKVNS